MIQKKIVLIFVLLLLAFASISFAKKSPQNLPACPDDIQLFTNNESYEPDPSGDECLYQLGDDSSHYLPCEDLMTSSGNECHRNGKIYYLNTAYYLNIFKESNVLKKLIRSLEGEGFIISKEKITYSLYPNRYVVFGSLGKNPNQSLDFLGILVIPADIKIKNSPEKVSINIRLNFIIKDNEPIIEANNFDPSYLSHAIDAYLRRNIHRSDAETIKKKLANKTFYIRNNSILLYKKYNHHNLVSYEDFKSGEIELAPCKLLELSCPEKDESIMGTVKELIKDLENFIRSIFISSHSVK